MGIRLGTVLRSLISDWPRAALQKLAAGLAKLVLLLLPLAALLLITPLVLPLLIWVLLVVTLGLFLLVLLINALVRWFPREPPAARGRQMPALPARTPRLAEVLGPYNSQDRPGLRLYDAVFEGGGVKAIGQIGALARLDQEGLKPRKIVGTSGGAIVGAGLAAGATPAQLWNILAGLDLTEFLDPRWLPNQRWLRRAYYGLLPLLPGVLLWKAAVRGRRFKEIIIEELFKLCGLRDPTFAQLGQHHRRNAAYDIELHVIATDITRRKMLVLPDDIAAYRDWQGRDPNELSVAEAVRMSMAIPFVFEPVRLPFGDPAVTVDIVDGGVSSNYPIWHFDTTAPAGPRYPTFGFLLDEDIGNEGRPPTEVRSLFGYALNVVQAGIGAIDRLLDRHDDARTIRIPTRRVGTTDFDLSPKRQQELFDAGYDAADKKLAKFVWSDYVVQFRGGRARISAEAEDVPQLADERVTYTRA